MKIKNKKPLVIGGFLAAFLVSSFFIANASHYSGDKIQKDPASWLNPVYRCNVDALRPMTSKTKGETVKELQNCLRILNESYVPMDGTWDRETRKSVKWFYKHFLGKKSNGKKFDEAAIERMKELVVLAEPFLEIPPEEVSETPPEDVVSESLDLQQEVERILAVVPAWQKEIEKKAAAYGVKLSEKEILKKQQLEGIETVYSDIVKWGARARKEAKKDYEEAYRFAQIVEEAYLLAPHFFQELDVEVAINQQREAEQKEIEEAEKKYEAEAQALREDLTAQKAQIARLGKETLEKIFQYFRFTAPAGYITLRNFHDADGASFMVIITPEDTEFWLDSEDKINYYDGPSIRIELRKVDEDYTFEVFEKEMLGEATIFSKGGGDGGSGAIGKKITLGGIPWYRVDESNYLGKGDTVFLVSVSTVRNGFFYRIALNEGGDTPDAGTLKNVRGDFEKMIKTVSVSRAIPSKIEPAAPPLTKEQLLLQGTWKQTKTFFPDDFGIGYPPVKAHLIAFQTNKICSFIQEDAPNKCYTKYVNYRLDGDTIIFKESGEEKRWEILSNTAYGLEIVYQNGAKDIFQKTSNETPSGP